MTGVRAPIRCRTCGRTFSAIDEGRCVCEDEQPAQPAPVAA